MAHHILPVTRARRLVGTVPTLLAAALVVLAGAAPADAQLGAGLARSMRLEPSTSSAVAASEFAAGLLDLNNIQPARGAAHLARSLEADASLGVARALHAFYAAGLSRADRQAAIERGVVDAAKGSPAELLVAASVRARFNGDLVQARDLLASAAAMVPNDPHVAFMHAVTVGQVPTTGVVGSIAPLREVIARFPDYAPSYNILAYGLYRAGDRAQALDVIRSYVARAPNEPNAHDSAAELLQWAGRLDEAIAEYRKALTLDPDFTVAAMGIAEAEVLAGRHARAREALTEALPRVTAPATRISFRRAMATSHVLEGNEKAALTELGNALDEATKANLTASIAGSHLDMAYTNALVGDGKAVASHASAVGTGSGLTAIDRAYNVALAHAIAKQNAPARTALADLRTAVGSNQTAGNAQLIASVEALVLLNEGKAVEANAVLGRVDPTGPVTRAVLALTQHALGNAGTARSLRDEILGDRVLSLTAGAQIIARRLVMRVN